LGAYNAALQQRAFGHSNHGHLHGHHHHHWNGGYGYPIFDYGYWNSGIVVGHGPYWPEYYLGTSSGPLGPYWAPPAYVAANQLGFGPQAMQNFMGVDPAQRGGAAVVNVPPAEAKPDALPAMP